MQEDERSLLNVICEAYEIARSEEYERTIHSSGLGLVIEIGKRHFLPTRLEAKDQLDPSELRAAVVSQLCGKTDSTTRIVQVVGDSGTSFDKDRIREAQQVLERHAGNGSIIEYGMTSRGDDANWLVGDYIEKNTVAAERVLANVVGESVHALESGWTGSERVKYFVLLYQKGHLPTRFGEDMWLSDGTMSAETGDVILCFEGGVQALSQCVNALERGIKVVAVPNLRPSINDMRFSAAELLSIVEGVKDSSRLEPELKQYLDEHWPEDTTKVDSIMQNIQRLVQISENIRNLVLTGWTDITSLPCECSITSISACE